MQAHTHTYIQKPMGDYTNTYTHTDSHMTMHACLCIHAYIFRSTHIFTHIQRHTCDYTNTCTLANTYITIMHAYTHKHTYNTHTCTWAHIHSYPHFIITQTLLIPSPCMRKEELFSICPQPDLEQWPDCLHLNIKLMVALSTLRPSGTWAHVTMMW